MQTGILLLMTTCICKILLLILFYIGNYNHHVFDRSFKSKWKINNVLRVLVYLGNCLRFHRPSVNFPIKLYIQQMVHFQYEKLAKTTPVLLSRPRTRLRSNSLSNNMLSGGSSPLSIKCRISCCFYVVLKPRLNFSLWVYVSILNQLWGAEC